MIRTAEATTQYHPDKICDQIADAILDECLRQDPMSRVAVDAIGGHGTLFLIGEITTKASVDYEAAVRDVIRDVGYTDEDIGFSADTCKVVLMLGQQSPDIAMGVNEDAAKGKEIGAGDQGLMFGYACNDTPELMPLPISLAHKILSRLTEARFNREVDWLRPDSKSQVTVEYHGHKPARIDTVVVSTQHDADVGQAEIRRFVVEKVVGPLLPPGLVKGEITYHVNPTASLVHAIRSSKLSKPVKILVGGLAFAQEPRLWRAVGADGFAPDAEQAVKAAQELVSNP